MLKKNQKTAYFNFKTKFIFQPPVEADSWSEIVTATSDATDCPQMDDNGTIFGNEDCLYLNVYSPRVNLLH